MPWNTYEYVVVSSVVVNAKCTLFSGLHASALTAAKKKLLPSSSFLIYSEKLSIIQSDDFFEENQKVGAAVTSIWVWLHRDTKKKIWQIQF